MRAKEPMNGTPLGYYGNDVKVSVGNGQQLHILREGRKFKIVLLRIKCEGVTAIKLASVSEEAIKEALMKGTIIVEGRKYCIVDTKPLKRLLCRNGNKENSR